MISNTVLQAHGVVRVCSIDTYGRSEHEGWVELRSTQGRWELGGFLSARPNTAAVTIRFQDYSELKSLVMRQDQLYVQATVGTVIKLTKPRDPRAFREMLSVLNRIKTNDLKPPSSASILGEMSDAFEKKPESFPGYKSNSTATVSSAKLPSEIKKPVFVDISPDDDKENVNFHDDSFSSFHSAPKSDGAKGSGSRSIRNFYGRTPDGILSLPTNPRTYHRSRPRPSVKKKLFPDTGDDIWLSTQTTFQRETTTARLQAALSISPPEESSHKLVGFSNLGNTCYMNAILQSLFTLQPFVQDLLFFVLQLLNEVDRPKTSLAVKIAQLVEAKDKSEKIQKEILIAVKQSIDGQAKRFSGYHQQDAHELLLHLLDQLSLEVLAATNRGALQITDSVAVQLNLRSRESILAARFLNPPLTNFSFEVQCTLTCLKCDKVLQVPEYYQDMSVPCPKPKLSYDVSIQFAILQFFQSEILDYKCEACGHGKSRKDFKMGYLPRVLVVHLKRFEVDPRTLTTHKIATEVNVSRYVTLQTVCDTETQPPLTSLVRDANFQRPVTPKEDALKVESSPVRRRTVSTDSDSPRHVDHVDLPEPNVSPVSKDSTPRKRPSGDSEQEDFDGFIPERKSRRKEHVDKIKETKPDSTTFLHPLYVDVGISSMDDPPPSTPSSSDEEVTFKVTAETQCETDARTGFSCFKTKRKPSLHNLNRPRTPDAKGEDDMTEADQIKEATRLSLMDRTQSLAEDFDDELEKVLQLSMETARVEAIQRSVDGTKDSDNEKSPSLISRKVKNRSSAMPASSKCDINHSAACMEVANGQTRVIESLSNQVQANLDLANQTAAAGFPANQMAENAANEQYVRESLTNEQAEVPQNTETCKQTLEEPNFNLDCDTGEMSPVPTYKYKACDNKSASKQAFDDKCWDDLLLHSDRDLLGPGDGTGLALDTNEDKPDKSPSWDAETSSTTSATASTKGSSHGADSEAEEDLEASHRLPINLGNWRDIEKNMTTGELPHTYQLCSVVSHTGSTTGGHYISDVLDFHETKWARYNDLHMSEEKFEDLVESQQWRSDGYIFFYIHTDIRNEVMEEGKVTRCELFKKFSSLIPSPKKNAFRPIGNISHRKPVLHKPAVLGGPRGPGVPPPELVDLPDLDSPTNSPNDNTLLEWKTF